MRSQEDEEVLHGHEQELVGEFAPAFVYPIFGEEETIFGYRELEINVRPFLSAAFISAERLTTAT